MSVTSWRRFCLRNMGPRWLAWCLVCCCLIAGQVGWAETPDREAISEFDDITFMFVGTWRDKKIPRPALDSVYTFQATFTIARSGTPESLFVPAADLKGEVVKGDRLILVGYFKPKREPTFRVHAMTPSAERLVAELSQLPAETKEENCYGQMAIPICAAHLSSEDLATRVIARSGLIGWVPCAQIQAAKNVPMETLQKLSRDERLGRRVHETAALLLASRSPADSDDLIRLIHRLRDEGEVATFDRDCLLSLAYLTALREKGIPTFLNDAKWSPPPIRRQLVHIAIDTLEEAKRPLDRKVVLAFCEESLTLEHNRINAIRTLEQARFWDMAPRLLEMFRNGPFFEENRSSRVSLRSYLTQFVLTWRGSVDPSSESYREAVKMLEEFEKIDAEAVEFAKSLNNPASQKADGC